GVAHDFAPLPLIRKAGADMVAVNHRLARVGVLRQCGRAGIPAMVWTVNAEPVMRRFLGDPRVAVLVTDRPDVALKLREERYRPRPNRETWRWRRGGERTGAGPGEPGAPGSGAPGRLGRLRRRLSGAGAAAGAAALALGGDGVDDVVVGGRAVLRGGVHGPAGAGPGPVALAAARAGTFPVAPAVVAAGPAGLADVLQLLGVQPGAVVPLLLRQGALRPLGDAEGGEEV